MYVQLISWNFQTQNSIIQLPGPVSPSKQTCRKFDSSADFPFSDVFEEILASKIPAIIMSFPPFMCDLLSLYIFLISIFL